MCRTHHNLLPLLRSACSRISRMFIGAEKVRQLRSLRRILDGGPTGFEDGGMSGKKYISITGASKAAATRDLQIWRTNACPHHPAAGEAHITRLVCSGMTVRWSVHSPHKSRHGQTLFARFVGEAYFRARLLPGGNTSSPKLAEKLYARLHQSLSSRQRLR